MNKIVRREGPIGIVGKGGVGNTKGIGFGQVAAVDIEQTRPTLTYSADFGFDSCANDIGEQI